MKTLYSKWTVGALALLLVGGLSGLAYADPIGGPNNINCPLNSCQGAWYTLNYSGSPLPDVDLLHETYRVTLTIDTNTYTGGGGYIDAVALKISSSVFSSSLFAAPVLLADWAVVPGGINASGCSGAGGGFDCADWVASGPGVAVGYNGGILAWTFDQTINNGTLFLDPAMASIKARYVSLVPHTERVCTGTGRGRECHDVTTNVVEKVGALVSENIFLQGPPVPEPASLLLMGSGLVGLGLWGWKRRREDVQA